MKTTLRVRAYRYLKSRPGIWVSSGDLEALAMKAGYKGSTVSRRLRELAEDSRMGTLGLSGRVEAEEKMGVSVRCVWYRWMPPLNPSDFVSERKRIDRIFEEHVSSQNHA